MSSIITVNGPVLKKCLAVAIRAGLVGMIGGSPGIGKSALVHELAAEYNLKVIDVRLAQCDPTDLNGPLFILECKTKAGYVPMETFPLEGDPLPINPLTGEAYQGWLIFYDEINSAVRSVQAASYKVVLDRMIGQAKLHANVVQMAAGNLDTDGAIVEELSSALQSRMVHYKLVSHAPSWLGIAAKHNIDPRITSYINTMPQDLNTFDPTSTSEEKTYACERTWFFVDRMLKAGLDLDDREVALPSLAGTISQGVARKFMAHGKMFGSMPTPDEIIKDPKSVAVPTEPGHLYALCGSIAHRADDTNINPLMDYLERFPKEYQVTGLRDMTRRNEKMLCNERVVEWTMTNGNELV